MFSIIAAVDHDWGIGKDRRIPWILPPDMRHFYKLTVEGTVIMGRNTWESLPNKPLKNRRNIIITSKEGYAGSNEDVYWAEGFTFDDTLRFSKGKTFIIGGQQLYEEAIGHPECEEVYLTQIGDWFDCDKFFPAEKLIENFALFNLGKTEFYYHLPYRFGYWVNKSLRRNTSRYQTFDNLDDATKQTIGDLCQST